MPTIDRSRVEHVAGLARIALTDEELDRFTGQLEVVLGAIKQLKDVDTSAVPPSASVLPLENVMREDEPRPSLPVEVVMSQAPDREGDLFRVQASLEERPDAGAPAHDHRDRATSALARRLGARARRCLPRRREGRFIQRV